jgi:hypothetical protein
MSKTVAIDELLKKLESITGGYNKNLSKLEQLPEALKQLKEFFTPLTKEERVAIFRDALKNNERHEEERGYGVFSGYEGKRIFSTLEAIIKSGDLKLWQAATEGLDTKEKLRIFGAHDDDRGDTVWHLLAKAKNPELLSYSLQEITPIQKIGAFSGYNLEGGGEGILNTEEVGNTVWHTVVKNKNPEFAKIAFEGLSIEQRLDVLALPRRKDILWGGKFGERVVSVIAKETRETAFEGLSRIQRLQVQADPESKTVKNKDGTKSLRFAKNGSRILIHQAAGDANELENSTRSYLKRDDGSRKYVGPEGTLRWSEVIREHDDGSAIYKREEPFRR